MAKFNYAKEPVVTFAVDQRAERFSIEALKACMLPRLSGNLDVARRRRITVVATGWLTPFCH